MELAVRNGNKDIVELLFHAGVPLDTTDYGQDPFTIAALNNNLDMMEFMLGLGADINRQNSHTRRTALHIACDFEALPAARFLLEHGANPNVQDNKGRTPLIFLAENGCKNKVFIQTLIQAQADLNIKKFDGWSALMLAAEKDNAVFIRQLLEAGVELEDENNAGYTALALAILNNAPDAAALLQEAGANTLATTGQGSTMLMGAAYKNALDCIRLLVDAGADIHATDKSGMTAMDYARMAGATEALELLESLAESN